MTLISSSLTPSRPSTWARWPCVEAERPEAGEVWLGPGLRQPEGAKPRRRCDRFRPPSGVYLEVPGCCRNRGVAAVIEDDQPARAHQLAQVEQVDEYVVKDVASVHERGVGNEVIGQQTGQGGL